MKTAVVGILLAITVLLSSTALGLAVIHVSDFPYSADIETLEISESAGLSREELLINYNAVMAYLSPFSNSSFALPTLNWTAVSVGHFADVKTVFNYIYILGALCTLLLLHLSVKKLLNRSVLRVSGLITLLVPIAIALAVFVNFDWTFNFFHSIIFNGDTWLLDPNKDGIIKILPSAFFLHCALFIALFWLAASAVQLKTGYLLGKTYKA